MYSNGANERPLFFLPCQTKRDHACCSLGEVYSDLIHMLLTGRGHIKEKTIAHVQLLYHANI